jgi:N-acetylglucosamine-6-phosphate deacetylase
MYNEHITLYFIWYANIDGWSACKKSSCAHSRWFDKSLFSSSNDSASSTLSCDPDIHLIRQWQKIAKDKIKLVTVAPELPGAIPFIQALRAMGIVVSAGHTDATYEQTCAAIAAGCSHATHLFNAMRGLHQREPGAVGALLLSDCVTAELIVDGEHLHPAIVDLCLRVKGANRLMLVSDAMRAKCLGDGEYELGGQSVSVRDQKATLADGTLAGSVLQLPAAIKNIIAYTGCSLAEAVSMASYQPACLLNIDRRKGSVEIGKDADVVVLNEKLEVALTLRGGNPVYPYT